ncbi:hypothetical protein EGW08_000090 [Elysia chlorotica]|uniref:Uncharacterized protein n=1 Tax=Elysia chlorotica TaxID=188477 RepID=A0A433UEF5_ELYCH|nr:hypothetical protein EGW08_000090 [Elysia chlorotica]
MIRDFNDLGYFLVRGILSPEELSKIKQTVETESFLRHAFWALNPHTGTTECRKVMWRHPGNDVTGMLARSEKIAGTCEKVLGGEVYHYHTKLMTKAARTGGKHVWHQDYGGLKWLISDYTDSIVTGP